MPKTKPSRKSVVKIKIDRNRKRVARDPPSPPSPEREPVIPREKKEKKRPKREISWSYYVFKVLREIYPEEITISRQSMSIMNDLMDHVMDIIAQEAGHLSRIHKRGNPKPKDPTKLKKESKRTLMVKDVESAVKLILPGELARIACSEGGKAVRLYTVSVHQDVELKEQIK